MIFINKLFDMDKMFIKNMLRESLMGGLGEASDNKTKKPKNPDKESKDKEEKDKENFSDLSKDEKKRVKSLTAKIKNATQGKNKLLKLSQVMGAAGLGDPKDASDRSLYRKKVSGEPDSDGNVHHLSPPEAAKMGKIVDNPNAYM
jgi:hypothetical protein